MRLRNHAKWIFIALAIVFVFSFVVAGVGSGSTGVGDLFGSVSLFGGDSSTSNPVKAAQKKVDKAGNDTAKLAPALHELGKAQAAKATDAEAEATYHRYLKLRPNDVLARHELALLYQKDADEQFAQLQAVTDDVVKSAPLDTSKIAPDPIATAVHTDAVSHASRFYTAYSAAKHKELDTLAAAMGLAKGNDRANILTQAGPEASTAVNAALTFSAYVPESPDAATAQQDAQRWAGQGIAAYKELLKLHQHDSLKAQIQQRITELLPYAPAPAKSSGR